MTPENVSESCPPPPPPAPPARTWRLRTSDGRIRALAVEHVQILLNAGLLDRDTCIADLASENWQPIGEHEIWLLLRHPPNSPPGTQALAAETTAEAQKPGAQRISREVTPQMAERMHRVRQHETDRLTRALWLHRLALWTSRGREAGLFVLFLGLGDVLGECIPSEMGVTKLGAMLVVLTLGTGYIAWRGFKH